MAGELPEEVGCEVNADVVAVTEVDVLSPTRLDCEVVPVAEDVLDPAVVEESTADATTVTERLNVDEEDPELEVDERT